MSIATLLKHIWRLGLAASLTLLIPAAGFAAGPGQRCGGIAGILCDRGLFCEMKAGQCNTADGAGRCETVPRACPRIFLPVCGCNHRTYSNDCERKVAGVSKAHDGRCEATR